MFKYNSQTSASSGREGTDPPKISRLPVSGDKLWEALEQVSGCIQIHGHNNSHIHILGNLDQQLLKPEAS